MTFGTSVFSEQTKCAKSRASPFRHEERINRKGLAPKIPQGARREEYGPKVLALRNTIKLEVRDYVSTAESEYKKRVLGQAT